MNSVEHIDYLARRDASAVPGSLRAALYFREGVEATDAAIRRGLRAWAVERRRTHGLRPETTIVFARSRSDALRRASAPARLAQEIGGDETIVALILSGWEEPVRWPLPWREVVR